MKIHNHISHFKRINPELFIWPIALIGLWISSFYQESQFSLCPLYNLGFENCPGCGIGRSIGHLLHGEIAISWRHHPLGVFAVLVILHRIYQLTIKHFRINK